MDVLDLPVHEALQQVQALLRGVQGVVTGVQYNNAQSDPRENGLVPKKQVAVACSCSYGCFVVLVVRLIYLSSTEPERGKYGMAELE